jgi:hypothetical protein
MTDAEIVNRSPARVGGEVGTTSMYLIKERDNPERDAGVLEATLAAVRSRAN